ncbi:MAG: hypothetical protein MI810_07885, partial [Flavobacteriales bacterium]|nr:hypothetical protein [Flavobacteriales bacterium]
IGAKLLGHLPDSYRDRLRFQVLIAISVPVSGTGFSHGSKSRSLTVLTHSNSGLFNYAGVEHFALC